jgi:hypothetical protein
MLSAEAMLIFSVSFQADQMPEGGGKRILASYNVEVCWEVALRRVHGLCTVRERDEARAQT